MSEKNGSIYKRQDGRWVAQIFIGYNEEGKKKTKTFYGKTRSEAKKKLEEYKEKFFDSSKYSSYDCFAEYIVRWMELYKKPNVKPVTYDVIEATINNIIIPELGYYTISEINTDILQSFFNGLKDRGYSYETILKVKNIINPCLKQAVFKKDLLKNSIDGVMMPSYSSFSKREISILNDEDIQKFVAEATRNHLNGTPVYRYGYGLVFILYTGLRVGEALNLKWKDIDYINKLVKINGTITKVKNRNKKEDNESNYIVMSTTPKTEAGIRTVPLCNTALKSLENLKQITLPSSSNKYIFSTDSGKIVARNSLYRNVKNIAIKADIEIENCNLHTLRHTFASMLFKKGVDVKAVSALLGHSKVEVTYNRYIHLIKEQEISAINVLDDL